MWVAEDTENYNSEMLGKLTLFFTIWFFSSIIKKWITFRVWRKNWVWHFWTSITLTFLNQFWHKTQGSSNLWVFFPGNPIFFGKYNFLPWHFIVYSPRLLYCPCDGVHQKICHKHFQDQFLWIIKDPHIDILTMMTKLCLWYFFKGD